MKRKVGLKLLIMLVINSSIPSPHCLHSFAMGIVVDDDEIIDNNQDSIQEEEEKVITNSIENVMVVVDDQPPKNNHQRQLYDGNPWWLATYGIITEIQDGNTPEIKLYYEVDRTRPLSDSKVTVYAKDCTNLATAVTWQQSSDTVIAHPNHPLDMNLFVINLQLDEAKIYTSNIWTATPNTGNTEGKIEICVQMELVHQGMKESVSIVKTRFIQNVKLESNYALTPVGAAQIITSESKTNAKVSYNVGACVCDGISGTVVNVCKPPPSFQANTVLRVCIWSDSKEVEIAKVFNLKLEQKVTGGVTYTYEPIAWGNPNDLSTVTSAIDTTKGKWSIVKTNILTRFFTSNNNNPQPITVYGIVLLNFRTTRRHLNDFHHFRHPHRGLDDNTSSSFTAPSSLGTTTTTAITTTTDAEETMKQAALESGEGDGVETFEFLIPVSYAVSTMFSLKTIIATMLGITTLIVMMPSFF